ncbi:hypothetical protein LQ50_16390 [Halalkalibacter okhensis]|uniref:Uncharacterized protein n=1 Tax=Halalkalibacter okhensis TaxID=333138 RepID=A0A0B0IGU2_9BACI|nr:hypothetical protein LQ50_16390 [Halalkalibacter okhensis]
MGGEKQMAIIYTSPFWFSLIIVFIIMFVINYITQMLIKKKNEQILSWGFTLIVLIQSLVITIIFEIL